MKADTLAPWQPERDQWGRPKIVAPDGTTMGYTRASTLAKTLDSEGALGKWGERMVGAGLAIRPDLLALIQSHMSPNGDIPQENKQLIQGWVGEAKDAAKAAKGANLGTALHKFTETIDKGEQLANVPEFLAPDIEAYRRIMDGIEIVAVEQFVVIDQYRVAGTFDRILRYNGDLVIGDLKTTQDIRYSHNANSVQLAGYSRGTPYRDGVRGVPLVDQGVRQDYGVVIWLPSGGGFAELYTVDLTAGWEAFELSVAVRKWRDRQPAERIRQWPTLTQQAPTITITGPTPAPTVDLFHVKPPTPTAVTEGDPVVAHWLKHRIMAMPDAAKQTLARLWPADLPTFKSGHVHNADELDIILHFINVAETEHNVPFGEPDPRLTTPEPRHLVTPAAADLLTAPWPDEPWRNEKSDVPDAQSVRAALNDDFDQRPPEMQQRIADWLLQARAAGCGFSLSECMSWRRVTILNACYALIEHLDDDELIHAAIAEITSTYDHPPIGARVGRLNQAQATALGSFARSVGCGDVVPIFDPEGRITHFATKEQTS